MYVYHYSDLSDHLIFRYDNTGHHKGLDLPTYPEGVRTARGV
ncbi:MAG: toxin-antitoxin system TumE family protein [Thermodesulfobacteriota bacterium]